MPMIGVTLPPNGAAFPGGALTVPPGGRVVPYQTIPVSVDPTQEQVYKFTRFHLELPVVIEEKEIESATQITERFTKYKNELEAKEALEGKEGQIEQDVTIKQITPLLPWERVKTFHTYAFSGVTNEHVKDRGEVLTERTVLPFELGVMVELLTSEGTVWSSTFEVPMKYAGSTGHVSPANVGILLGYGFISTYVDLVNPIFIPNGTPLSVRIRVASPASVPFAFNTTYILRTGEVVSEPGNMELFYDPQPVRS